MPLAPGTRLGPYEVLTQIGAGGMGEVYKARDTKLDRLVAVKVLPSDLADGGDLLARFEREAKAVAALNHPNILGIYDFGHEGLQSYAVMELLEGESLRERLKGGPLTPRKAVELARQIAEGLAAAHARGILHRDIKPENIFLTREGRVKVLDFGLAKHLPNWTGPTGKPHASDADTDLSGPQTELPTQASSGSGGPRTAEGMFMGTVGYVSPEQVRGEPTDHRSDIFAFGTVLYEMVSGRQAFKASTGVQTLSAILQDDPPELIGPNLQVPPALERLIFHCLEKEPHRRFQSMQDLAYDLQNLSTLSSGASQQASRGRNRATGRTLGLLGLGALALLLLGGGLWASNRLHLGLPAPPPSFHRLSFVPGTVEAARFGPDGKTIYFSQRVAGGRPELFVIHPGAAEPKALGIPDALLLGVSGTSELSFLRAPRLRYGGRYQGILARAPGGGGAQRELLEDVAEAVWDGEGMATLSVDADIQFHLEFPAGRQVLTGSWTSRTLGQLCLSRDGARLALRDSDTTTKSEIVVYDRQGHRQVVYTKKGDINGDTLTGLAWGPDGELRVSELQGDQTALWALSLSGRQRLLWRGAGDYQLMDVAPDGRVLLAQHQVRRGVLAQKAGEAQPTDLSIFGNTQAKGLSADGRSLLLLESPIMEGGTAKDAAYLRPTGGGQALKLGRGLPQSLSADGRWVHMETTALEGKDLDPSWAAALQEAGLDASKVGDSAARSRFLLFVPTGLGRPFAVPLPEGFVDPGYAYLLGDEQHVVATLTVKGKDHWVLLGRRRGEAPRILTRESLGLFYAGLFPISPDGTGLIVSGNSKDWFVQPMAGGEPRSIPGLQPGERILGWTSDGKAVHVRPELSVLPVTLTRIELATGARRKLMAFTLPDPVGHIQTRGVFITPDARSFAFTYDKKLSGLFLVDGLP